MASTCQPVSRECLVIVFDVQKTAQAASFADPNKLNILVGLRTRVLTHRIRDTHRVGEFVIDIKHDFKFGMETCFV